MKEHILCKRNDSDEHEIEQYKTLLDMVKEKHSIPYSILEISPLEEHEEEELLNEIRQVAINGISVKTQGNGPLPIARNRNKLGKTGILLQYEDNKLKSVYPHVKNQKRFDVMSYLNRLFESDNINDIFDSETISEGDIARMISTFPDLIEDGLQFVDTEVGLEGGRIDAVFKNDIGEHLLIEIEIEAKDNALGQVQRFNIPYSEKYGVPLEMIRLGLVCAKISDSRIKACEGASIEVYTLSLDKKV